VVREFDAISANEPGWRVRAAMYEVAVTGDIVPKAEIDAMMWIDPAAPADIPLAPLTRDHVLPLASRTRASGNA
jgi:8-oxo-dGTP diphosphatase